MTNINISDLEIVSGNDNLTIEQTSQIIGGSLSPERAATCTLFGGAVAAAGGGPLGGAAAAATCILILGGGGGGGGGGNISDIVAA